jgi:hypothetical protein
MKKIFLVLILFFNQAPSQAYNSGDTIYVNKKRKVKTPLVQKKFVIMNTRESFQRNPENSYPPNHSQISGLNQELEKQESKQSLNNQKNHKKIYKPEEDWDSFAVESEFIEEKNVSAKIRR